jgi:hypothetical protein
MWDINQSKEQNTEATTDGDGHCEETEDSTVG